jgi:glycosyltransferase involved in cell wall biosynthesis
MKKLNVAVFFIGDFPEGGATVSRIKGYLQPLKNKHRFTINILWQDSFSQTKINDKTEGNWEGIPFKFHNHNICRPQSMFFKLVDSFKAFLNSSIYILKNRKEINIIYFYNPEFIYGWNILLLSKLFKIPLVIEQTELQSSIYNQVGVKKNIFYFFKKTSEKYIHHFCDAAIVISDKLFSHYQNQFPNNNIYKIPALVDLERFKPISEKIDSYKIGYIGSFGIKDGIPDLLRAFAKVKLKLPQLKLRLIGNYDEHLNILKIIEELEIKDSVELTGRVYFNEVPELLSACDLLICNRINSEYANYGFPSKLAEYMALCIPVIATDVSDISKYISDEYLKLIPAENVDLLINEIINRYTFYELYNDKANKAIGKIKLHFSNDTCAQMLENILFKYAK